MRDAVFVRLAHEHRGERGWMDSSLLAGGNAAGAIGLHLGAILVCLYGSCVAVRRRGYGMCDAVVVRRVWRTSIVVSADGWILRCWPAVMRLERLDRFLWWDWGYGGGDDFCCRCELAMGHRGSVKNTSEIAGRMWVPEGFVAMGHEGR